MKKLVLKKQLSKSNYSIDYKSELNESQYNAVMHQNGAALVIAGAGTGKTRIVIYRVARLIEDGVDPTSIVLLTFTRKAAEEMKRRSAIISDARCNKIFAGTYHSFALSILVKYAQALKLSKFSIIDQSDSDDLIDYIRTKYLSSKENKLKRFPQKSVLSKIISTSINKQESIKSIIESDYPYYIDFVTDIELIYHQFTDYKKSSNLLNYDDLLLNLHNILKNNHSIRKNIIDSINYIMVDEYQDSNRLQHEIVLMLANKQSNIMVVGDDAQSIYSFRGAEYQNIIFFPKSFENCSVYKIEENYRSSNPILKFTNEVINNAPFSYKKNLFSNNEGGEKPIILSTKDERQQSLFIVQHILEEREKGVKLEDIAVLFRSNFHSFDLEIELNNANIPFKKYGGLKLMESAHIKDALAYLKFIHNDKDIVALTRILKLIKGVGNATINKINDLIIKNDKDIVETILNEKSIKTNVKNELLKVFEFLAKTKKDIKNPASEIIKKIIEFYSQFIEETYDNVYKRQQDLDTLSQIAERYASAEEMLNELSISPAVSSVEDLMGGTNEDEFLTLSTIHSAKGLEWKSIFIIWALDGKFPSSRAADNIDSLEEERRLFYVASTRAKENLYITYPTNIFDYESGFVLSKPSRFIDDADEDTYERYTLIEEE